MDYIKELFKPTGLKINLATILKDIDKRLTTVESGEEGEEETNNDNGSENEENTLPTVVSMDFSDEHAFELSTGNTGGYSVIVVGDITLSGTLAEDIDFFDSITPLETYLTSTNQTLSLSITDEHDHTLTLQPNNYWSGGIDTHGALTIAIDLDSVGSLVLTDTLTASITFGTATANNIEVGNTTIIPPLITGITECEMSIGDNAEVLGEYLISCTAIPTFDDEFTGEPLDVEDFTTYITTTNQPLSVVISDESNHTLQLQYNPSNPWNCLLSDSALLIDIPTTSFNELNLAETLTGYLRIGSAELSNVEVSVDITDNGQS